jgi:hypothetical protein
MLETLYLLCKIKYLLFKVNAKFDLVLPPPTAWEYISSLIFHFKVNDSDERNI